VRLWRISNFADLSGQGGLLGSARWHSRGRRIVYMAGHPASALLEVLVHLEVDPAELPDAFQLLAVGVPDGIASETVQPADLAGGWKQDLSVTRAAGDRWLSEGRTALLHVPSAIVPACFNCLLNPAHRDASTIKVDEIIRAPFDARLMKKP
jgi:RES domain-containing protein